MNASDISLLLCGQVVKVLDLIFQPALRAMSLVSSVRLRKGTGAAQSHKYIGIFCTHLEDPRHWCTCFLAPVHTAGLSMWLFSCLEGSDE